MIRRKDNPNEPKPSSACFDFTLGWLGSSNESQIHDGTFELPIDPTGTYWCGATVNMDIRSMSVALTDGIARRRMLAIVMENDDFAAMTGLSMAVGTDFQVLTTQIGGRYSTPGKSKTVCVKGNAFESFDYKKLFDRDICEGFRRQGQTKLTVEKGPTIGLHILAESDCERNECDNCSRIALLIPNAAIPDMRMSLGSMNQDGLLRLSVILPGWRISIDCINPDESLLMSDDAIRRKGRKSIITEAGKAIIVEHTLRR